MSDKKQTAVSCLEEKLGEIIGTGLQKVMEEEIQQALKMEKQQIIDAWADGITNWDSQKTSEHYYNETYKP